MVFGDAVNFHWVNDAVESRGGRFDGDAFSGVELLTLEGELLEAGIEDGEAVSRTKEAMTTNFENSLEFSIFEVKDRRVLGDIDFWSDEIEELLDSVRGGNDDSNDQESDCDSGDECSHVFVEFEVWAAAAGLRCLREIEEEKSSVLEKSS